MFMLNHSPQLSIISHLFLSLIIRIVAPAEIVIVHHLVACSRVESRYYGKLVFGIDIVSRQRQVSTKTCCQRHIVAIAGLQVGVAHVRCMGIDIIFKGVELVVVGSCNASGVGQTKTFHHVGGIVTCIECGEKVELILFNRAHGIICIGILAAQTRLNRPTWAELASHCGIHCPDML